MTDPMTAADLDAIEQRLAEGRIVNVVAQRALFAEVCRLRAMEQRVRALHAEEHQHYSPFIGATVVTCSACGEPTPCPTIAALNGGE